MIITLTLLGLMSLVFYLFLTWNYDYWRKRGVASPKAKLFVGSFPNLIRQKQHFVEDINDIYNHYKSTENFVGVFLLRTPMLMIVEPQLVHDIFVTNFKSFHDNDAAKLVCPKKDPLIAKNPFLQLGAEWREQRGLISPGMTGARVKVSYSIMQGVCRSLCEFIEKEIKVPPKDGINAKDLALRFTCENVSDSVLGIKARSFTAHPIPISENVRSFAENNNVFLIYAVMTGLFPKILKLYKAKFINQRTEDFFLSLMKAAFKMRLESATNRQDFMNHLMTMREKNGLSDTELASHAMTFMIDGLDTTATVISHCLLMLGRHADYQERLYKEITESLDKNGEISFEKLNELPFLEACLYESMRILPPGMFATKICTETFEFRNKNGTKVMTNVGDTILLPLYSLHMDADYFPEPDIFNPERFMPENGGHKKYRDIGVLLPFGDGPRTCMGIRFALVQTKSAVSSIVKNFHIKLNPKTKPKNKLDPKAFLALQDGGVWLDFEKRI